MLVEFTQDQCGGLVLSARHAGTDHVHVRMAARGEESLDVAFVDADVPKPERVFDEVTVVLLAGDTAHFHLKRQDAGNVVECGTPDVVEARCLEAEAALGDRDHHVLKHVARHGGGGGGGGPRTSAPGAPRNLMAVGGDGEVVLTWDAPASDGGAAITDYEYRINGRNPWISIGSTETTHTVTGLVNGAAYTFEVRAVNRIGKSRASNQTEATPVAPEVFTLDFAHFANGNGTTSDLVFVNVAPQPVRPALYFYDTEGNPIAAESVVDITGDLEISEDGGLTVLTEMEPLGELTIATHGQGDLVSGSVKVASEGLIGGMLRFDLPGIGEAVVEASPPISDALFPVRRREGGITTGVAIHNLESSPGLVRCDLLREGVLRDAASLPLEANGQTSWLIDQAFPGTDTSDFAGSVRCDAVREGRFSAVALEMDPGSRIFITLPVFPVNRLAGAGRR